MRTENVVLMRMARESLSGKWGLAIGTFLVFILCVGGVQAIPKVGQLLSLLITGPMALGMAIFSLSISRNLDAGIEMIFQGFTNFGRALGTYLLMVLYILLWTLLLIVPGIIAGLSYSMTFFILAEDDTIGADAAIEKSKMMMNGYKWKYFCLSLRFLGLALLCILTLGIGFLWLFPFMQVTVAKFYDDVKLNQSAQQSF